MSLLEVPCPGVRVSEHCHVLTDANGHHNGWYARRLHSWIRDAAKVNAKRLDIIKKYRKQALHEKLFDELRPLQEEWFVPETWAALSALRDGDARLSHGLLNEHARDEVFSFPLFTDSFCDTLLEEVFHFYESGLPARRPNSMNNYGIILSDIGLEPFIDKLQELLQPFQSGAWPPQGEEFFQAPGCLWDGHHCFIVRYREGEDLGLDMHTDDSEPSLEGSFRDSLTAGERLNLILWNHSSEFRQSRDYRNPPYAREGSAPDAVCLSYTHDRDFGAYKDC
eukprot:s4107_g9.t1